MNKLAVWRFIEAVRDFKDDGFTTVSQEEYGERLTICQNCPTGTREFLVCSEKRGGCGCLIHIKATARSWDCPKGHWPEIQQSS